MSDSLNPREYDLLELRTAIAGVDISAPGALGRAQSTPCRASQHTEQPTDQTSQPVEQTDQSPSTEPPTLGRQSRVRGHSWTVDVPAATATRPYLQTLPSSYSAESLIFEWLEGLVMIAGVDGARQALTYYRTLEWISPSVTEQLIQYLEGLRSVDTDSPMSLTVQDHRESLWYIARLAEGVYHR